MHLAERAVHELRRHGIAATLVAPPWLTERGHLDAAACRAPSVTLDALDDIHAELGGDRRALGRRRPSALPAMVCLPDGRFVAIDGVEHFTSDRLASFAHYPSPWSAGFDVGHYRQLIDTWRQCAAHVFTRRWSPDFDFAGGRRARRAYEDALRDLLTPVFTGRPLWRIAAPDHDLGAVVTACAGVPSAA
jgi:hypothetical protein